MNKALLKKLKQEAKKILDKNTRFHDYGHAIEVLENVQKLLKAEGEENFDKEVLFVAALFHDASDKQDTPEEGREGAEIAEKILLKIKVFPNEKIKDVKRLIIGHTLRGKKRDDEILFESADQMAAFSDLGLIRSFMMSGKANMKIGDAVGQELTYLEKRFNKFKLSSAREIVRKRYENKKSMLKKLLL